jgi:hypothetical protein
MFLIHFQKFLDFIPTYCSRIIINNFNIDILMIKTNHNKKTSKLYGYYLVNLIQFLKITILILGNAFI